MNIEYCPPVSSDGPHFAPEVSKAKEAAQTEPSTQNTVEYHELVEGSNFIHCENFVSLAGYSSF